MELIAVDGRDLYLLSHVAGAAGQMETRAWWNIKRGSRCEPGYSRELTGSLEPALAVAERERGGATLAIWSHTRATLTHSHEGPHEV